MTCRKRWELAAAFGAALIAVTLGGREARAEKLWTERPAELRSSPGDDSQVVKRVAKGKSLEVVKRLGTWVMVEYEGRTGWIRRTALSGDPVSGGGSDQAEEKKEAKKEKKESKKSKAPEPEEEEAEEPASTKAAAAGAKRTAAKKKAERRKTRSSRHDAEAEDSGTAAADAQEEDEEIKSGKPRSTWNSRGLPGGPLKVEIQAISVQAFEEPTGKGRIVFTAKEGDRVRVIARGKDRWLLVENAKKRTGWIPAVAVRDHGLLLEARKDASEEGDAEEPKAGKRTKPSKKAQEEEADEEEVSEVKEVKKTRTAAASDGNGDEGEGEVGLDEDEEEESPVEDEPSSKSSDDDEDASLGSSSLDDFRAPPKPWTASGSLRGGFAAVAMDTTPTGGTAEEASYNGPTAGLVADFAYRLTPRLGVVANLTYDWSYALGGLTHNAGGTETTDIKLSQHRIGASLGASFGKEMAGIVRVGYQYAAFLVDDLNNAVSLPRETTQGPTVGAGFVYSGIGGTGLGARLGVDAMLFGSRSQTEGSRDGDALDSLLSLWGAAQIDYPIGKNLLVGGGYRFGYTKAAWSGPSERNVGAMETDEKSQAHEINLGVGWRL